MEFKCINDKCSKFDEAVSFNILTAIIKNGEVMYKQAYCAECQEYMKDITEHTGFGTPFKAKGDRTKKYYDRGKSQNVHK